MADTLAASFEERFWLPDEGCYALGIDGNGVIPSVAWMEQRILGELGKTSGGSRRSPTG